MRFLPFVPQWRRPEERGASEVRIFAGFQSQQGFSFVRKIQALLQSGSKRTPASWAHNQSEHCITHKVGCGGRNQGAHADQEDPGNTLGSRPPSLTLSHRTSALLGKFVHFSEETNTGWPEPNPWNRSSPSSGVCHCMLFTLDQNVQVCAPDPRNSLSQVLVLCPNAQDFCMQHPGDS